ncbi:MAG: hypothetical protein DI629_21230, partial [Mesorhizobium amorphae]
MRTRRLTDSAATLLRRDARAAARDGRPGNDLAFLLLDVAATGMSFARIQEGASDEEIVEEAMRVITSRICAPAPEAAAFMRASMT